MGTLLHKLLFRIVVVGYRAGRSKVHTFTPSVTLFHPLVTLSAGLHPGHRRVLLLVAGQRAAAAWRVHHPPPAPHHAHLRSVKAGKAVLPCVCAALTDLCMVHVPCCAVRPLLCAATCSVISAHPTSALHCKGVAGERGAALLHACLDYPPATSTSSAAPKHCCPFLLLWF